MTVVELSVFSAERFLEDVENTCAIRGAPYSKPVTKAVIEAYRASFNEETVGLRPTHPASAPVNPRLYDPQSIDTVAIAVKAGFLSQLTLLPTW